MSDLTELSSQSVASDIVKAMNDLKYIDIYQKRLSKLLELEELNKKLQTLKIEEDQIYARQFKLYSDLFESYYTSGWNELSMHKTNESKKKKRNRDLLYKAFVLEHFRENYNKIIADYSFNDDAERANIDLIISYLQFALSNKNALAKVATTNEF